MSTISLEGHVAVVTGASKGLGREMAEALAGAGAKVALVARNEELLSEVVRGIRARGGTAEYIMADVTDETAAAEVDQMVKEAFGVCDILINNAGINNRKPIEEMSLDEWHEILEVNLTGPFSMSRTFVPGMKGLRWGRIINMTSIMSHVSLPNRTGYSTTKSGLLGFTRALALELAPYNITVNGISPGPFATEMNRPLIEDPEKNSQFLASIPVGRWGKVEEIGSLAVYMCSEGAGFLTGTDVVIDGGWTAR
ncbi:MAG: SDR family NAD(P)-dependent oxidoreductase [Bryobacterales bacterium]|nr:SDR family NAD(P)-dependent oxidoreductase [Bryobacterales bacterium]MDE0624066.1 SDR family NAD(P)-dependent oxidoreductase [Bryobacterales bacterium]